MDAVEANENPAHDSNITIAFDVNKPNLNVDLKNGFMRAPADDVDQE